MAENGCSEDPPYSQAQIPTARFVGSCFCERPRARKTARRTTIGAWSRTSASQVAVSCSVTFCTWGRSIPRRLRCGAKPSRCSTTRDIREHFRCSPRIAARASRPIRQSSNFACRTCSYAGLAKSVAVAGVAFDRPCRTKRPSCQSPAAYRFSIQAVALSMPNEGGTKSPLAERVMGDPRPSEKGRSPCGDYCCLDSSISAD
jgi:hypothetical protein